MNVITRPWVALLISVLVTWVLACGGAARAVYLHESDAGRLVVVQVGDNIQLQLPADDAPWVVSSSDLKTIDYKQGGQVAYSGDHRAQLILLQAISVGTSTVTACPRGPCEGNGLIYRFRVSG